MPVASLFSLWQDHGPFERSLIRGVKSIYGGQ